MQPTIPICSHYFPVVECHTSDVTLKGYKGTGTHTVVVELCATSCQVRKYCGLYRSAMHIPDPVTLVIEVCKTFLIVYLLTHESGHYVTVDNMCKLVKYTVEGLTKRIYVGWFVRLCQWNMLTIPTNNFYSCMLNQVSYVGNVGGVHTHVFWKPFYTYVHMHIPLSELLPYMLFVVCIASVILGVGKG